MRRRRWAEEGLGRNDDADDKDDDDAPAEKRIGFNDNDDDEDDADDDDAPAEKRPGCVQLDEVDVGPTLAVHFLHTIICNFPSFSLIFALSLSILFCVNHLCKIQFFF